LSKKSYTYFDKIKKMKTVVICGSRRFKKEIREFESKLTKAGIVVFLPHLHEGKDEWDKLSPQYKKFIALGLTHDHFYKIKMADVVFVYNKDGYAGVSTTLEIGYAIALGKPIYALSDKDEELCRLTLFREAVKTPKELISKLK
jgi:nucleoside 2-deoxyribosyltransferase